MPVQLLNHQERPVMDFLKSTVCVHKKTCGTLTAGYIIGVLQSVRVMQTPILDQVEHQIPVWHLIV